MLSIWEKRWRRHGPYTPKGLDFKWDRCMNNLLTEAMVEVFIGYDKDINEGVGNLLWG